MSKTYSNATNLRRALEERLNALAKKEGADIQTLRRHVAFDRLLARLFPKATQAPWALKGGYSMELRVESARTTKDIDLAVRDAKLFGSEGGERNGAIREELQKYAAADLGDFFVFSIGAPIMDLDTAPYGGGRFPIEAKMDQRLFIGFHLDVGLGDVWIEPLERMATRDWLAFAGITGPAILAISKEQQFAEKLHAYTLPRADRLNSRVKDLVDMTLLVRGESMDTKKLRAAINATFERRSTHEIPTQLPPPPATWVKTFPALAAECELDEDLDGAFTLVRAALDEFL